MKTAAELNPRRQFTVKPGPLLRTLCEVPKIRVMNWLTLVALSAAGASGAAETSDVKPATPVVAIAPASAETPAAQDLEGVVLPRAAGGFLQLKMEGVHIVLRTYDAEKKPVKVDVDRATVRLQFASRSPEQYVLVPSADGMSLTVGRPVRQPHVFRAYISFYRGESDEAVESYQAAYP
jgi:hypothetical protein